MNQAVGVVRPPLPNWYQAMTCDKVRKRVAYCTRRTASKWASGMQGHLALWVGRPSEGVHLTVSQCHTLHGMTYLTIGVSIAQWGELLYLAIMLALLARVA